jgi:hypothetical protein
MMKEKQIRLSIKPGQHFFCGGGCAESGIEVQGGLEKL